jgi:hypothetical protein
LPPVRISRKEAFGFALARKLLAAFEGTPVAEAPVVKKPAMRKKIAAPKA